MASASTRWLTALNARSIIKEGNNVGANILKLLFDKSLSTYSKAVTRITELIPIIRPSIVRSERNRFTHSVSS